MVDRTCVPLCTACQDDNGPLVLALLETTAMFCKGHFSFSAEEEDEFCLPVLYDTATSIVVRTEFV